MSKVTVAKFNHEGAQRRTKGKKARLVTGTREPQTFGLMVRVRVVVKE